MDSHQQHGGQKKCTEHPWSSGTGSVSWALSGLNRQGGEKETKEKGSTTYSEYRVAMVVGARSKALL